MNGGGEATRNTWSAADPRALRIGYPQIWAEESRTIGPVIATMALEEQAAAPPKVLNDRPRPRVLVLGLVGTDVVAAVTELAGYVEHQPSDVAKFCAATRWADWDAVILGSQELVLVQDREEFATMPSAGHGKRGLEIPYRQPLLRIARQDGLVSGIDDHVNVLAKDRACHAVRAPTPILDQPVFDELARLAEGLAKEIPTRPTAWKLAWTAVDGLVVWPLLVDDDGDALAVMYARRGDTEGVAPSFIIPVDAPRRVEWVRTIMRLWAIVDEATFGMINDWAAQPEWHTAEEAAAHAAAGEHRAERERWLAIHDARQQDLDARAVAAGSAAVAGWRRLLTDDGRPLVEAVSAAFEALGFHVVDVDEARDAAGVERLHDLNVTDPAAPDWIAITEVKGYTNGAKTSDLTQLTGRKTRRFINDHGREPDRKWFIANVHRTVMPPARAPAFHSSPGDVDVLRQDDGAVIDTRTLFRLVRTFGHADDATKAEVRAVLRERTGRWPLDERAAQPLEDLPTIGADDE